MICRLRPISELAGRLLLVAIISSLFYAQVVRAQCLPSWVGGFELGSVDDDVYVLASFDDGMGEALYAGGEFNYSGGFHVNYVAKWNGTSWSPLGSGGSTNGFVRALMPFDDGTGPALFAGGRFTSMGGIWSPGVAKWDGGAWRAVASGPLAIIDVSALAVFDAGSGRRLYAAGEFSELAGVAARNIAMWNGPGNGWSQVGELMNGTNGPIRALAVFEDATGPALYAGGNFTEAGGTAVSHVARWDGETWTSVGGGTNSPVLAMATYDDGSSESLYVGGDFTVAGTATVSKIARWNGMEWSSPAGGLRNGAAVLSLTVYSDGVESSLIAGGAFDRAGGIDVAGIARWDGVAWHPVGSGFDSAVRSLAVVDPLGVESSPTLYAGGSFQHIGDGPGEVAADRIASFDGGEWRPLGNSVSGQTDGSVHAFHPVNLLMRDSVGALCVAGSFEVAGGQLVNHVAIWDGTEWWPLGDGIADSAYAIASYDDGTGETLYVGGVADIDGLFRWNGADWVRFGGGFTGHVNALIVWDDGTGLALYAGGSFQNLGGSTMNNIAKWDGVSWNSLGSGVTTGGPEVYTLAVFDDGGGEALYVGGHFTNAGGQVANHIAKWNGVEWMPLGSGMSWSGSAAVNALTVHDDGQEPSLFAGGRFTSAGGVGVNHVARWDGLQWHPVGNGVSAQVRAIVVHDDGTGPTLIVGGDFTHAGGTRVNNIAQWDGSEWTGLGSGMLSTGALGIVDALISFDDGFGPTLFAGGFFTVAGDVSSGYIARWRTPQPELDGDFDCDNDVDLVDFAVFANCVGGSLNPPAAQCTAGVDADFDGDGDVDVADFAIFARNFTNDLQ